MDPAARRTALFAVAATALATVAAGLLGLPSWAAPVLALLAGAGVVSLAAPRSAPTPAPDAAPGPVRPAVVVPLPRRTPPPRVTGSREDAVRDVAALSTAADDVAERFRSATDALGALRRAGDEVAGGAASVSGSTATALESARSAATRVDDLLATSTRIGDVTGLIASITDQTRTLALNATIEAARAGDAGRGFAVVAGEVKELALATARAAQSISQQVGEVQDGTRAAAAAIAEVTSLLGEVAAAQDGVLEAVARQGAASGAIGHDVEQAARGSVTMAELVARRVESEQRAFCESALEVARDLLASSGGFALGERLVDWQLTEPSGETRTVRMPVVSLGGVEVVRNDDPGRPSVYVDDVKRLVGGTCSVFQRTPDGAMMRIASNLVGPNGKRIVGAVLAPTTAAGTPNPALTAVLEGRTYIGEANVLGTDYYTAYAPLHDDDGSVVGVLYVGLLKQAKALVGAS
ncbi:MAG: methyl-accepting chemotaxis sensory transducer [Frankiales bacterium]|nr:methyl-accepting chemotaxis sensory transducer [Frankiales bacterium]